MLVGVVSDTHGNLDGLRRVAARFKSRGIHTVVHLGDDYLDLAILEQAGFQMLAVPGVYCPEYTDPAIPNRVLVELAGVKLFLTHTPTRHRLDAPGDPDPEALESPVHLVLFGHTHVPTVDLRHGTIWLNPGHLKERNDRGHPPTFAVLELFPDAVRLEILHLEDGSRLLAGEYPLPPQT
ncbi:MAG: metallophosphoesterase family protein [Deltaproteobacteria bacterium]|nr:metallophosphoesterase family protein [Deltaproteobacteria bacterium]